MPNLQEWVDQNGLRTQSRQFQYLLFDFPNRSIFTNYNILLENIWKKDIAL